MKKILLLGAAAMMSLAVNAQIEKVWTVPADATTGTCSSRTVNGFGDVLYGANNGAGTIEEWKNGVLAASYDVNGFCATNNLGEEVNVTDADGNATGEKKFQAYTLWTAVMVDDAGNILANVGLGAGSATTCQNWVLLPASDRNAMQLLHIDEFPSADVTLGRVDVPAKIVGDIAEGAYLHIPATGSALLPVMYIGLDDDGKIYYDAENSWTLMSSVVFDSSSNVATFQTASEIMDAAEEGEVAAKTYLRWRGQGAPFTWNAETSQFEKNTAVPQGAGTAGMDAFKIGDVEYMVLPVTSATTGSRGSSVAVYNLADGSEVANWDSGCSVDYYVGSVQARVNADGATANIYVGGHKDCIALLKFTPGASAIESIAADANAPVEYYNLQGVKVAKAENGLFIKKQGNKAVKVVL